MTRRGSTTLAAILMLSVVSSTGAAAQDPSLAPASPVDVALLEALCEANAPDDAAKANCLDVVHDILAPEQALVGDQDIAALGQAYLLAVEEADAKMADAFGKNQRKSHRARAKILDELVADVGALEFPPAIRVVADRLIEATSEEARVLRELAPLNEKAPYYYELQARLTVAEDTARSESHEMRRLLGLPPPSDPFGVPDSE